MRAQALVLADSQAAKPARTDSPSVVLRRVPDQIGGQGLGRTAGLPLSGTHVLPGQTISRGASCDPRATSALTGSTFQASKPGPDNDLLGFEPVERVAAYRHEGPEQLGGGVLAPRAAVLGEHRIAQRGAELQLRAHAEQGAVDDVAFGVAVELPVQAGVLGVEIGF